MKRLKIGGKGVENNRKEDLAYFGMAFSVILSSSNGDGITSFLKSSNKSISIPIVCFPDTLSISSIWS